MQTEVERLQLRASMPKPQVPTSGAPVRYNAARRVKWRGERFAIHEAGADGLPICHLAHGARQGFADPKYADELEHLGYGPVNRGHCERTRST